MIYRIVQALVAYLGAVFTGLVPVTTPVRAYRTSHSPLLGGVLLDMIVPLLRDDTTGEVIIDRQDATYGAFEHFDFVVMVGTADIALDFAVYEDAASDGATATAVTGAAITALGASDDESIAVVSVPQTVFTKRYVKGLITCGDGTAGNDCAVLVIGYPRGGVPDTMTAVGAKVAEHVQVTG